jgi:hypothetical protein
MEAILINGILILEDILTVMEEDTEEDLEVWVCGD